jgi:hypothetical protein
VTWATQTPWNAGRRRYIIKRRSRELEFAPRGALVHRWSPWAFVASAETLSRARMRVLHLRANAAARRWVYSPGETRVEGPPDYAIFYGGKRVWP